MRDLDELLSAHGRTVYDLADRIAAPPVPGGFGYAEVNHENIMDLYKPE